MKLAGRIGRAVLSASTFRGGEVDIPSLVREAKAMPVQYVEPYTYSAV